MEDINVQFIDMDTKIPEQIVKNQDDSYTILINSKLSYAEQLKSYYHALMHIRRNDFDKENADNIEYNAHNMEVAIELCV